MKTPRRSYALQGDFIPLLQVCVQTLYISNPKEMDVSQRRLLSIYPKESNHAQSSHWPVEFISNLLLVLLYYIFLSCPVLEILLTLADQFSLHLSLQSKHISNYLSLRYSALQQPLLIVPSGFFPQFEFGSSPAFITSGTFSLISYFSSILRIR